MAFKGGISWHFMAFHGISWHLGLKLHGVSLEALLFHGFSTGFPHVLTMAFPVAHSSAKWQVLPTGLDRLGSKRSGT
jgi:hypothetical protein